MSALTTRSGARTCAGLLALLLIGGCASSPAPATRIHLLAINDFHGNLLPPEPLREADANAPRRPVGGVDALAAYVKGFRARHEHTLVVSAGDLIGASPLVSALFSDEPTIEAMNRVGLDLNAVGNHEFDKGVDELLRMQQGGCRPAAENTCQGAHVGTPVPFEGARFRFLAANVRRTATGNTVLPGTEVQRFGATAVGFIGLTLSGTPGIVDRSGITGLEFAPEAAVINDEVRVLRERGVEAIVVLLHEGGEVAGPRNIATINGCAGDLAGSPLRDIVTALDDAVDLVVSGHTHQAYVCRLPNRSGRSILVTSAHDYGRVVTEIALTLDARGDVAAAAARNVPLVRSDIALADGAQLADLVARYRQLAQPLAERIVGRIPEALPREPNAAGESPLGRVIADAQLAATRDAGAELAVMNPGGIRAGLTAAASPSGNAVSYEALFSVQPFANALVTMTLTGTQLHRLLEEQFADCPRPGRDGKPITPTTTRLLQVSRGLRYRWRSDGAGCARVPIESITLAGQPLAPARGYRVTLNSFLAAGGDDFAVLATGTERVTGVLDIVAMERHLRGDLLLDHEPRIERLSSPAAP